MGRVTPSDRQKIAQRVFYEADFLFSDFLHVFTQPGSIADVLSQQLKGWQTAPQTSRSAASRSNVRYECPSSMAAPSWHRSSDLALLRGVARKARSIALSCRAHLGLATHAASAEKRIRHEQRANVHQTFFRLPARSSIGRMPNGFVSRSWSAAGIVNHPPARCQSPPPTC
jgi:hypothetical protein